MISTTLALFIMTVLFMLGFMLGWDAGRKRANRLISFLTIKMEELRSDSKIKASKRDFAQQHGCYIQSTKLDEELAAESTIFMKVQRAISGWCVNHNEKDPFAL